MTEYRVFEQTEQVAQACAQIMVEKIDRVVGLKGECHIVLPGGGTPRRCLQIMAQQNLPWANIWWYPSDERCLPLGDPERNDSMIVQSLFSTQKRFARQFIGMRTENECALAVKDYRQSISDLKRIDIALLGLGEDGHTASLFPGNPALGSEDDVVCVNNAPKAPANRLSFGMAKLRQADTKIVIATGESKNAIIHRIFKGETFPVTQLEPQLFLLDKAAVKKN